MEWPAPADEFDDVPGTGLDAFDFLHGDDADERADAQVFTITNPPQTVSVTTYLDGRVAHVQLYSGATEFTETELADEILVVADLAKQDARSAQHETAFESMRAQGHDTADIRDFLTRNLDLPSPEDTRAARAQVFATRYQGETDYE